MQVLPGTGTGVMGAASIPEGPLKSSGRAVRYSVEVENGVPVGTAEPQQTLDEINQVAQVVRSMLGDDRGWQTKDDVRFGPGEPGRGGLRRRHRHPHHVGQRNADGQACAPLNVTEQPGSCWNGDRSVLNPTRWMPGSAAYGSDLTAYRAYLVNHEVGHGLGHQHVGCPGAGQPAPVTVQQTTSLEGCVAWPYPTSS